MKHPNEALLEQFYSAFQQRDASAMAACYHPTAAQFSDPVFTDLRDWQIGAMWQMLCERGTDLEISFSDIVADSTQGSARWEAKYTFTATGRTVHNIIRATFTFEDGHITAHQDTFKLWRWSRMALGVRGLLMGWMPPVQATIRRQAATSLERYIEKHSLDPSTD
ncbi:MAG: nuclear transport factor 2 family protein [Myxococcota bacterium]